MMRQVQNGATLRSGCRGPRLVSALQDDESGEDTGYRGRVLLYAACERPKPEERLQVMRLPMIFSMALVALMERPCAQKTRCLFVPAGRWCKRGHLA